MPAAEQKERSFCPLTKDACKRELCAWWVQDVLAMDDSCAILVLAEFKRREQAGAALGKRGGLGL